MCRDSKSVGSVDRQQPPNNQLELAWQQAWEACGWAAQCGDYATAEQWYRRATQLRVRMAAEDAAIGELWQSTAGASSTNDYLAPGW